MTASLQPAEHGVEPPAQRSPWRAALLLGLVSFVIYNANLRGISAGDTYPARYLPFAMVQYRTPFMNPVATVAEQGRGDGAFWMLHMPSGRIISLYPIVVPIVVAPLYVPAVGYLHWRGWTGARLDYVAKLMEKLSASFVASISVALMYVLLRRRTSARNAMLLACAYGFGTTTWMISSQALWQHGIAQLLVVIVLLLLTGPSTIPRAVVVALLCGLIACNRPPDAIIGAALGLFALHWAGRRRWPALVVTALAPMLLVLFYNLHFAGGVAGGYGVIGKTTFFSHPIPRGLAGLLVSPTRGLLVFSPFLLLLPFAIVRAMRERSHRILTLAMLGAVILQLLLYAKVDWRGGLAWGPRYTTDLLPLLIWMLVPAVERLRGVGRWAFFAGVGVAIALECIGAFSYTGSTDLPMFAIEGPRKWPLAFAWRNAPFLTAPRTGVAAPDFISPPAGSFDAVESGSGAAPVIGRGDPLFATGWALAGSRSPVRVALSLDGKPGGYTSSFTDRTDVAAALGIRAPSGWRIPIETSGLTAGKHRLTAMVWTHEKGEGYYLDTKSFTVRGASAAASIATAEGENDLAEAFRTAAMRIEEHQRPEGFWLTAHTVAPRFVDARPEMNTFLTALLVDLLDPVQQETGLGESLQSARNHLRQQIEPGGLVRYHGLTSGPWIGTLGCAITPDSDDTALAWRIAPAANRRDLDAALATMAQYRTADGLYKSWLAPRASYQCLDPGRDPNPTDIAIQMHMLLLLAKERPAEARSLCSALGRAIDDDRIWVYYRQTPVVPILRLNELRDAGCSLTLPERRMRAHAERQEIWVTVSHMLTTPSDPTMVRAVLRELARDDFALIRSNPPLLYHNDLTATVSRYYWSEDVGYALWLRLLFRYEHDPRVGN